jgi:hypothetical protein
MQDTRFQSSESRQPARQRERSCIGWDKCGALLLSFLVLRELVPFPYVPDLRYDDAPRRLIVCIA